MSTVREAVQILVSDGLVRREMHRGAYVAELTEDDVRDLFRVRRLVELTAVREIAGSKETGSLREAIGSLAAAVESGDRYAISEADLDFHRRLVALMDSERLGALYDGVDAEMQLCIARATPASVDASTLLKDHKAILTALERGNRCPTPPQKTPAATPRHRRAATHRSAASNANRGHRRLLARRLEREHHEPRLRELGDRVLHTLTPRAAVLDAAERHLIDPEVRAIIDDQPPNLNPSRQVECHVDRLGEQRRLQPIARVVGDVHRLVQRRIGEHRSDRRERLVAGNPHVR